MSKAKAIPIQTVGRCVYCRDNSTPLTEEHILAANLGGQYTLLKASCNVCQYIINKEVEQPVLQKMFLNIRYRWKIGSRNISKRPSTLKSYRKSGISGEVPTLYNNKENWKEEQSSYERHPTFLALPFMRMPGLLRTVSPEKFLEEIKEPTRIWHHVEPFARDEGDTDHISSETMFNDNPFTRLLAKTAHCATVAHFGIDGFDPYLLDLILGRDLTKRWFFIGCRQDIRPSASSVYELDGACYKDGPFQSYITCDVRLFADLGAPTYCVVVGKKR